MYRLFFVLILIVAVITGAGFYFGYLHIGEESSNGKTNITLTVDQKKIQADEKKAVERVRDIVDPSKE